MELFRIQDKTVSKEKIAARVEKILELRSRGLSQQEVADRLGLDRAFISRLESLGELRKGQSLAVIGFPIANKRELEKMLEEEGVDFVLLMTEKERTDFVSSRSGAQLLNELMDLIARVREFDAVILLGSDYRLRLMQGLLDKEVITVKIGESPLTEDKWVNVQELKGIVRAVKGPKSKINRRKKK